jgi:mono/diheme cytochrome c family protein
VLSFVVISVAGLGTLIGVGCALRANACPFTDRSVETASDGPTIWANNCSLCHGPNGAGGPGGPSLIAGERASISLAEIVDAVRGGKPPMPRFKGALTDEQIAEVSGYVLELRGEATTP